MPRWSNIFRNKRQVLSSLFIVLILLAIPLGVLLSQKQQILKSRADALPDPLAPECSDIEHNPQRSILNNWDLGGNYDANGAPPGWSLIKTGNVNVSKETGYEKFGEAGIIINGSGRFGVILFQTVSVETNKWYHAAYNVANQVNGPNGAKSGTPALKRVAVDLNGGTDLGGSGVIWGQRDAGGPVEEAAGNYDHWRFFGTRDNPLATFKTTGDRVTVFFVVDGYDNIAQTNIWLDTAFLFTCNQTGPGTNPTNPPATTPPGTTPPGTTPPTQPPTACQLPAGTALSKSCSDCIVSNVSGMRSAYNFFGHSLCSDAQVASHWCQSFNPTLCSQVKQVFCASQCP